MAYALITGGSKGIGKALAEELAKRKTDLLLVSRSEKSLAETASELKEKYGTAVHYLSADLAASDTPDRIYNWCITNEYRVNILINNAGFGLSGAFEKHTIEENIQMLQLNIVSVAHLTQLFLPELKTHPKAHILNIASTAAYQAISGLSLYAATKAFVLSFSRGLRRELAGTTVSVSCISPGPTETNFAKAAKMRGKGLNTFQSLSMPVERVAKSAVDALLSGKAEVIIGKKNKVGAFFSWLLPKPLVEQVAGKLYQ